MTIVGLVGSQTRGDEMVAINSFRTGNDLLELCRSRAQADEKAGRFYIMDAIDGIWAALGPKPPNRTLPSR
jgi:hypothetical protein